MSTDFEPGQLAEIGALESRCQRMENANLLHHANMEHEFQDGDELYRFQVDQLKSGHVPVKRNESPLGKGHLTKHTTTLPKKNTKKAAEPEPEPEVEPQQSRRPEAPAQDTPAKKWQRQVIIRGRVCSVR